MKERDPKEKFYYEEEESNEISQQIMGAYASGVIDNPKAQANMYGDQPHDEAEDFEY
ncbi:hypothetical protein GCM10008967_24790 [Bacillus carboniphilus]|uniref:DUF4025 domain-containing protein n=1 Tax=Bacillus carboniphilus TaxID=86663 RepID=A0ABP3G4E3_9BACI